MNGTLAPKDLKRFLSKILLDDGSRCWEWIARRTPSGYGQFKFAGKNRRTHRIAYAHFRGPIPEDMHIDHLCRNRSCCNPWHLEPVTCAENIRRGETGKRNALKTHCPAGHPYDEQNTIVLPKNGRVWRGCRECHRARDRERRRLARGGVVGPTNIAKTHCPVGHPYDADNTYVDPNGWRQCRACKRLRRGG